jgi:hypothetical protein
MAKDELSPGEPLDRLPAPRRRHGGMIVTAAILVIFGVVIWYVYQRATQSGDALAPPLIKAEQGPTKVAPNDPGGMQVPNQDKAIYDRIGNNGAKTGTVEKLLPPPEMPKPEAPAPAKSVEVAKAAPVSPVTAQPLPAPTTSAVPLPAISAPAANSTPPAPSVPDKPAVTAAAPGPSVAPTTSASPTPPTKPLATKPPATGDAGNIRIQLGAFRQTSEAEQAWQQVAKKFPDVLGGMNKTVVQIDLGERGVFQRLQTGPFPDRAAAAAACDKLKARNQGCIVVAH